MTRLHNELRKLWADAGYHTKMGSAAVVPPPPKKYRRLYYLTSAEYAVSNIVFSRIKVALLDQLNDPFELFAARFLGDRQVKNLVSTYKDKMAKEYGLLCFSADWTDPVLWTHYAAKHAGVCLGFDVPIDIALKVRYQTERLATTGRSAIDPAFEDELLRTKFKSWRYEQEWRVRISLTSTNREGGVHFTSLQGARIQLAEVILGHACHLTPVALRRVVDMHYHGVVTFGARLAYGSFNIVPNEPTIPLNAHTLFRV